MLVPAQSSSQNQRRENRSTVRQELLTHRGEACNQSQGRGKALGRCVLQQKNRWMRNTRGKTSRQRRRGFTEALENSTHHIAGTSWDNSTANLSLIQVVSECSAQPALLLQDPQSSPAYPTWHCRQHRAESRSHRHERVLTHQHWTLTHRDWEPGLWLIM